MIAAPSGTKTEIITDEQMLDPQAAYQQLFDEVRGLKGGEAGIKTVGANQSDPFFGKQFQFLP